MKKLDSPPVGRSVELAEGSDEAASGAFEASADPSSQFLAAYSRHQHTVHVYVRTLVRNHSDADDVMQEVSVTLWKKWDTFDPQTDFRRWALSVAFIEVLRYRRKTAKDWLWFSEPLLELLAEDIAEQAEEHAARLDALSTCVEKLNREDRQIIASRYRVGTPVRDIAEAVDRPASTVYKRLMRIRESLRRCTESVLVAHFHPPNTLQK